MRSCLPVLLVMAGACIPARAAPVANFAELQTILDDQILLEDFEGVSLAGGSSLTTPNPLNADSATPSWSILPGVTYTAPATLALYTTQSLGDDSNVLAGKGSVGTNYLTITFDQPQAAVGFYLVNITGNLDYNETVRFFNGYNKLGTTDVLLTSGDEQFVGWQHPTGITRITVQSTSFAIIDNLAWGIDAPPPIEGDLDADGFVGIADLNIILSVWNQTLDPHTDPRADPSGDGFVGIEDLNAVFGNWNAGTPTVTGNTTPEPTTALLLTAATLTTLTRRRK